jgi:hypothetical protein
MKHWLRHSYLDYLTDENANEKQNMKYLIITVVMCSTIVVGYDSSAIELKNKSKTISEYAAMIKEWREIAKTGEDGSKNRSVTWTLKIFNATQGSRSGYIGGDRKYAVVIIPTKPYYDARFPNNTEAPMDWADAIMAGKVPNDVSIGTWVEFSGRYYLNVHGSQEVFFIDRMSKISSPKN